MGCCSSIPHSQRRYHYDPADLDEEIVPIREFGNFRNGSSNLVPDDIDGLPSSATNHRLATDPGTLLYEAEIDQGYAFRCLRVWPLLIPFCPTAWYHVSVGGISAVLSRCACDEPFCWLRKEYSTRTYFRVYPNRIEVNKPALRIPWGLCGCGSWNADAVVAHPFDRGAFGFRSVKCCVAELLCCVWPVYGGVVARQRCPCNGSLWPRLLDCGGWWCDEWVCDIMCCSYRYAGIADPEETAFAAGIALQAYFENRKISREDMDKCITYWRENISEYDDPIGRKRNVCCEPFCIPLPPCILCHEYFCHIKRVPPYEQGDERFTDELDEIYKKHEALREKQLERYQTYTGPVQNATFCRQVNSKRYFVETSYGCRRFSGRRGLFFCTEGTCLDRNPDNNCCSKKSGDPAPPFTTRDIDDENDASIVMMKVLGPPPVNVRYRRWMWDEDEQKMKMVVIGAIEEEKRLKDDDKDISSATSHEISKNL